MLKAFNWNGLTFWFQNMRTYFFAAENKESMSQWMNALSLASICQQEQKWVAVYVVYVNVAVDVTVVVVVVVVVVLVVVVVVVVAVYVFIDVVDVVEDV